MDKYTMQLQHDNDNQGSHAYDTWYRAMDIMVDWDDSGYDHNHVPNTPDINRVLDIIKLPDDIMQPVAVDWLSLDPADFDRLYDAIGMYCDLAITMVKKDLIKYRKDGQPCLIISPMAINDLLIAATKLKTFYYG
jgi:hypothetical protein